MTQSANSSRFRRIGYLAVLIGLAWVIGTQPDLARRATGAASGCQDSGTWDDGAIVCDSDTEIDPSGNFENVQFEVFDRVCVSCHSATTPSGGLDLSTSAQSYAALVNVPVDNDVARENGWRRVVPNDPDRSFLIRKVLTPGVGEGAPMPPGDEALVEPYVDLLIDWIEAGAPAPDVVPPEPIRCVALEPRSDSTMTFGHPEDDCASCHEEHFNQWAQSPHAYAWVDPVFHAMVDLGQKQSGGKLGQFCVQCHTPIGMATGQTQVYFDEKGQRHRQNITDIDDLAKQGVSCDVCHSISEVLEPVNARMIYSPNGERRGTIVDPVETPAHASVYSELHASSDLCGSCHAVTTGRGALVEETYGEWAESSAAEEGKQCQDCHMPTYRGHAAPGAPERSLHDHHFVGVDVSLLAEDEFPGYWEMRERTAALLRDAATLEADWNPTMGNLDVSITNLAGHAFPSGATAERQLWLEVILTDSGGKVLFESGTPDENGDLRDEIESHSLRPGTDPQLAYHGQYLILDTVLNTLDDPDALAQRRSELTRNCYEIPSGGVPEASVVTFPWQANWQCNFMIGADETAEHSYTLPKVSARGHQLSVRLLFRSFAPYFLQSLEDEAGLDPAVKTRVPLVVVAEWQSS